MITTFGESVSKAAQVAASEIALDMAPRRQYRLACTNVAGIWFRVVKAGEATLIAAVAGAGSHWLGAGQSVLIAPIGDKARISVIREAAVDGVAILSEIPTVVAVT